MTRERREARYSERGGWHGPQVIREGRLESRAVKRRRTRGTWRAWRVDVAQIASGYRGRFTETYFSALLKCTSRRHTPVRSKSQTSAGQDMRNEVLGECRGGRRRTAISLQLVVAEQSLENSTLFPIILNDIIHHISYKTWLVDESD